MCIYMFMVISLTTDMELTMMYMGSDLEKQTNILKSLGIQEQLPVIQSTGYIGQLLGAILGK